MTWRVQIGEWWLGIHAGAWCVVEDMADAACFDVYEDASDSGAAWGAEHPGDDWRVVVGR